MPSSRWVIAVVLAAAVLRAAAAVAIGNRFYFADEAIYVDAAHRLFLGEGLGADYHQAPGFPVFLVLLSAMLPGSILTLRVAQGVIAGLGTALVYVLAERIAGRGPALAAAAIYALDPLLLVSAGLLYPETVAAVLLVVAILAVWQGGRDSLPSSGLAGVLVGTLALFRPVALVLLPVVAVWIAVEVPRRRAVAHFGLVTVAALLVLAPWTYRNYRIQGHFAPIAVAGIHTAPVAPEDLVEEGLTISMLKKAWTDPGALAARTMLQFLQFWELAPTRLTTDDPKRRAVLHQRDPRLPTGAFVPPGVRDLVSVIASTAEFGLALYGLGLLWRRRRLAAILIGSVTIAFALGYALFAAKLRYRIPVLPLVFVLAGVGAWQLGTGVAALGGRRTQARGRSVESSPG